MGFFDKLFGKRKKESLTKAAKQRKFLFKSIQSHCRKKAP